MATLVDCFWVEVLYNIGMKKIQDVSAFVFISCVGILATISVLGVWKIFDEDVISKSIMTISLLAAVTIIVTVAGKFFDGHAQGEVAGAEPLIVEPSPVFRSLRYITLTTLIISVVVLALLGVLAIWDVMEGETLGRSLSSMSIIAFSSFVIVLTCLLREQHKFMKVKVSGWAVFGIVILGWILLTSLF